MFVLNSGTVAPKQESALFDTSLFCEDLSSVAQIGAVTFENEQFSPRLGCGKDPLSMDRLGLIFAFLPVLQCIHES